MQGIQVLVWVYRNYMGHMKNIGFCLFSLSCSHISTAAENSHLNTQMLCISTSFWVLRAPKSWPKHFFQTFFNLFCSFQIFFIDFTAEINKNVWKWTKKTWFCPLLKAGRHAKAEGVPQNCLFEVFFTFFNVFQHISNYFSLF